MEVTHGKEKKMSKEFEVGKVYENGFSVEEYGIEHSYSSKFECIGRSAKFAKFREVRRWQEGRQCRVKIRVGSDGVERVSIPFNYPGVLSSERLVVQ